MKERVAPNLDVVQRWMLAVITHPDGVEAGIESDDARRECQVGTDRVEDLICRSQSQSSIERLAVYSNAYIARLLEVMIGEYPALCHALGQELFNGFATDYLKAHPPRSHTLAELGRMFPDYLARTRPPNENVNSSPDWADFLIDLARLERNYSEIFDGPGTEGLQVLQAEQFQSLSAEQWLSARLIPAPCLRVMTFRFPVHEYASAVRRQQDVDPPDAAVTHLAITRREYIVRRIALGDSEFRVLSELIEGRTIREALELAMQTHSGSIDELAIQLNDWFRNWSAAAYFIGFQNSC